MARVFPLVCTVWFVCGATVAFGANPAWLYTPAGPCGEALEDSLAPPPGATAMAVLPANITRKYTCPNDKDYVVTVQFLTPDGELAAVLESTASSQDRPISFVGANGSEIGSVVADQASEYAVTVDPTSATWTRRAVRSATGALEGAAWVVRGDTQGVASPGCEGVADGQEVTANYQAVYVFYGCGK